MFNAIANLFRPDPARRVAPAGAPPPAVETETSGMAFTAHIDPGAPVAFGETVPRWPEHGAALVAASPEALLATQAKTIARIKSFSPLVPSEFDRLVLPVFVRYTEWVHLLPASESHHHYGPGGLLSHGLEVAMHAARIADGRQVGVDLNPSERAKYLPRWKLATMLGGLFHDLGKPLVDCGATSPDRTITWSQYAGSLYQWLVANKLEHYRIYWRSGARHERHKPVGPALIREVLGEEMLNWLSDEPTNDVMNQLMVAVAQGRASRDLMAVILSQADSTSVEADLKMLAQKTQGAGQGGARSVAALAMGELRKLVEKNEIEVNKPGGGIWVTTEGVYCLPGSIDKARVALGAKEINGVPGSQIDFIELLIDSGFIEPCTDETSNVKQYSTTWKVALQIEHKGEVVMVTELLMARITRPEIIFGDLPMPPAVTATAHKPFVTDEDRKAIAASVVVAETPQSEASALGEAEPAPAPAPDEEGDTHDDAQDPSTTESVDAGPAIESRRNRRDLAFSAEDQNRRDRMAKPNAKSADEMLSKVEKAGLGGPAIAEVLRRVIARKLKYSVDVFESGEGLHVRYPQGFQKLGIPETDLLTMAAQQNWVLSDPGSDRKVCERPFPNGERGKCVILSGLVQKAWEVIREEDPTIMIPGSPPPAKEREDTIVPKSQESEVQAGRGAPRDRREHARPETQQGHQSEQGSDAPPKQRQPPHQPRQQPPQQQQPGRPDAAAPGQHGAQGRRAADAAPPARPEQGNRQQPSITPNNGQHGRGNDQMRPAKPQRPAVGAIRAPDRQPTRPDVDVLAKPDGSSASAPANAPVKPPVAPVSAAAGGAPAHNGAGQQVDPHKHGPVRQSDLACQRVGDLTRSLIGWYNCYCLMSVMKGLVVNENISEPIEHYERNTIPAEIRGMLEKFASGNNIRMAVLLTALADAENPSFVFKMPASMQLKDVKDMRLNPNYVRPLWMSSVLKTATGAHARGAAQ